MNVIRWKFREFYRKYGNRKNLSILIILPVILYAVVYFCMCGRLWYHDICGYPRPRFLWFDFKGGLANHMFQYAFAYSMAKERKLQLIIDRDNMLTEYFHIKSNRWEDHGYNRFTSYCFREHNAQLDCGYDNSIERLPAHSDLSFYGYFQSWKYWIKFENDIKKAFTFQSYILSNAQKQFQNILSNHNVSVSGRTIIGVHIRKGDYTEPKFASFGYRVATESYIKKAVKYYNKHFKKCFFIICSNDIKWTTKVFSNEKNYGYYIVNGNTAVEDMALLSLTQHTIMTVGTYGWMIAWLTGGKTIFYKYPYVENSRFAAQFHSNYSDHFYPGWIAME